VQKFITLHIVFIFISFSGYCQILNDSSSIVYNAKTSLRFTQYDIENNTSQKISIDTSIINLHNYNFYYKNSHLYQDLGAFGTPLNRIYYTPPNSIGKKLGLTTLNEYGYNIDDVYFFDTKSPYTKLNYIQGTRGQQILEVEHSQNVKPNWNIGFSFKRMVSSKQIGVATKNEKQMSHYSFRAHTSYHSKNNRYNFLFSCTHLQHQQYENGGIYVDSTETKSDMFDYKLELVQLYSQPSGVSNKKLLRTYDRNSHFRFYNEYAVFPKNALQVFHTFDYHTNTFRFDDNYLYGFTPSLSNSDFYPAANFDTLYTHDKVFHELYENKAGIKGSLAKFFYSAYLKRRDLSHIQKSYISSLDRYSENYIGGRLDYRFTDTLLLSVRTEYYIGRDYLLEAKFSSKIFELGYHTISYSPTLFQTKNISNHYVWNNNFQNTQTDYLYVSGKLNYRNLVFAPIVNFTNINRLVYFDQNAVSVQSTDAVQFLGAGFMGKINWRGLFFENHLRYTKITGADVWRAPEFFNQAKIYLYGPLIKKALLVQLGVDVSYKSGYYGNAYTPAMSRFYLSDRTNDINFLDGYLLADVYMNAQIKRGLVFLKLSHANLGLPSPGYFMTPYYTGLPRSFEFGVKWLFYD